MARKIAFLTSLLLAWTAAASPWATIQGAPTPPLSRVSSPIREEGGKAFLQEEGRGHTWIVGREGFATIGQALVRAHEGDTILVQPGVYRERLVISKAVRLVGEGRPVVDGGGQGDVLTIKAGGATVQGFIIRGSGRRLWRNEAAVKVLGDHNTIRGNEITNALFGIFLLGASGNTIVGNRIQGLGVGEHDRGNAIHLFGSHRNHIEGNMILYPRDGLYFEFSNGNRIRGNYVLYGRIGLHYMYSDDNTFEGNVFQYNGVAAAPMYAKRIVARRNLFAHSRGYGAYGLFLKDCEDSLIEENSIVDNEVGIFMDNSRENRIRRNLIAANTIGARILSSSINNLFTGNAFVENGDQVHLNRGRLLNRWEGNYWSDYRGYDLDGDGTGDIPYKVGSLFGFLSENYPEVRILFHSPAVRALAFAEEALPVLELPREEDRSPRMRQEDIPFALPTGPIRPGSKASGVFAALLVFGTTMVLWRAGRRRSGAWSRSRV
ncbi:MAG: nitrous oxide reductase family maturation protein NosD [Armatimonadota bacterium]|nr:nitrous oxide reductase family maturation protein NosD [Armatimonadota bacterium]MDR5702493.1 nitrous oxide reductase family maturation protein NosD [Armatimonadota bacterium]MDR7433591.1 nitrous oxide reductase family maturation protein NosD [Armatimonadota bacterium]